MKKIFLMVVLFPSLGWCNGPKYTYPSVRGLDDEMNNIYHDIKNPVINQETVTSAVITSATITNNNGITGTFAQIVTGNVVTGSSATTTTIFANTNVTATITTHKSTNKVVIQAIGELTAGGGTDCFGTIMRGGVNIANGNGLAVEDNAIDVPTFLTRTETPGLGTFVYTVGIRSSGGTCTWNRLGIDSLIQLQEIWQ